jgi:hypothetical protein
MEKLERLQNWYQSNCDGNWEHQYGISIDTLDNPGWRLSIDLKETYLETFTFDNIQIERSENDWLICQIREDKFEGFGGIYNLAEILDLFLDWADNLKDV